LPVSLPGDRDGPVSFGIPSGVPSAAVFLRFGKEPVEETMKTSRIVLTLLGGMACMLFASQAEAQDLSSLRGTVVIDGSSTVAPISTEAASMFSEMCPNVAVPVGVSGTGGGFKRFTKGETDISDASRPIKFAELQQCRENKVEFLEIPVAYDGLTIIISRQNDFVDMLTVDQLKKIFRGDMMAKRWSDVDPSWPDQEIKIFAPGTDSGTFDYFKEVMVGKEEATIRGDMSVSEDDNHIVTGVANTKNAIGFLGAAYYFENTDKLKCVRIVNPETAEAVEPTAETIESGEYAPFSRPLFIYVNANSARRPEVKVFVRHYLDNAADMAEAVGYVGLPDEVYEAARQHFEQSLTGTHFWTAAGEKAKGSLTDLYTEKNLLR
jgi:phosphate transport system substrate-binding protein